MELRTLDPKILQPNPANPRHTAAGEQADAQLIANIRALGILQPPVVRQENNEFIIVAGHRRIRAAITLGLPEILVLIRDADDGGDSVRAVSENVVRSPLGPVDQWKSIEALSSDHWTDEAIGTALALPIRTIKKLRLLAHIHPAMLDYIAKGDMPDERQLRIIAAASAQEQASVWKKYKPKNSKNEIYWQDIAHALEKRRLYAKIAQFGPDEVQAFGIEWQDDLFAPADEDTRYTTNVEAFFAAQTAWLEANLPKNGIILPADEYGQAKLPPKAERIWGTPKKSDTIGHHIDPRDGSIKTLAFKLPKPEPKKGKSPQANDTDDFPAIPAKTRPEITQKGMAIIGDLRTDALTKALLENSFDDTALLSLLLLALNANNIEIKTGEFIRGKRQRLFQAITEGGHVTQDLGLLRRSARETLALIFSCKPNFHSSGLAARFAGDAIAADVHLPSMATEEFLSCLSKTALERAAASLGVPAGQRAKDTRAALIKQAAGNTFVLPAARFAPEEHELAAHQEPILSCDDDTDDDHDIGEGHASNNDEDATLEDEQSQGDDDLDNYRSGRSNEEQHPQIP